MPSEVFKFLPGDQVLYIYGMPGPDTEPATVISDDGGDHVVIRFRIYGRGPFFEEPKRRDLIMWEREGEVSKRFYKWKAAGGGNAE